MPKKIIENKFILLAARVLDHKIGFEDNDKPDIPPLPISLALLSLTIRLVILLVNFITCAFVIANILHHW